MKHAVALLVFAILSLSLTACGSSDPHEAAVQDAIDVMSDFKETLAKVEDVESVKSLEPKFEKIGERLQAVAEQMSKLEEPSEEKAKELEAKYKPEMDKIQDEMKDEMKRIKGLGPDVLTAVMDQMSKMEPEADMPDWMK